MAYFDWNATAPILPEVREAWMAAAEVSWANPSSAHRLGRQARLAIEEAREEFAGQWGVQTDQVIFTSGATEAINGFFSAIARKNNTGKPVWISGVEHSAVRQSALAYWGHERVRSIPVLPNGLVDVDWMRRELKIAVPGLVAVMAANNETGVLSPWETVRDLCRELEIPFFCDAVQWMGKIPANNWQDCSGVSISAHKFGGPKGTGCLILGRDFRGLTIQAGGSQEIESRAGTEDVPGVLAMRAAFRRRTQISCPDAAPRDAFEAALSETWPGEVSFNGQGSPRLWNTSSVSLPTHQAARWVAQLDKRGFHVSAGSACSTGKPGISPVLEAMHVGEVRIRRTIRISGGWETRPEDWEALLKALVEVRAALDDADAGPGKVIQL